jgi:hypothetical protein
VQKQRFIVLAISTANFLVLVLLGFLNLYRLGDLKVIDICMYIFLGLRDIMIIYVFLQVLFYLFVIVKKRFQALKNTNQRLSWLALITTFVSFLIIFIEIFFVLMNLGMLILDKESAMNKNYKDYLHYLVFPIIDLIIGTTIILVFYKQTIAY